MNDKKILLIISISLNILLVILMGLFLFLKKDILFEESVDNTEIKTKQEEEEDSVEDEEEAQNTEKETEAENVAERTVYVYYFDEEQFNEPNSSEYLSRVERTTNRVDVATYTLEQIIDGPTAEEKSEYSLNDSFGSDAFVKFLSESDCSGKDFSISIDNGLATVRFCRETQFLNDNSDLVLDQIVETLKQFSTIDSVTVLTSDGDCFSAMGGYTVEECVF
jgi:hypothetical protein